MNDGWTDSADAWLHSLGDQGDFSRRFVLDAPMIEQALVGSPGRALDVGCGEGRFCRMMRAHGVETVGIDPTPALLARATTLHPEGDYREGRAETLDFEDGTFDLVVSYLTLIDIPDIRAAIPEMVRVLKPGGRLLIANLTSFNTAGLGGLGWIRTANGKPAYAFDRYLEERVEWITWAGIKIRNWHRPLETYMSLLLGQGLVLKAFAEPPPNGGDPAVAEKYRRAPWLMMMAWEKPADTAAPAG
ncbi:MAG: class I SAM-dependent methyltransferase [Caulobacter sp.]